MNPTNEATSKKEVKEFEKKMKIAHRFVKAMSFRDRFRRSVARVMQRSNEADLDEMLKVGEELCDEHVEQFAAEVTTLYAMAYDKKTLKGMAKFAKSKAGQAYIGNYTALESVLLELSQKWMQMVLLKAVQKYESIIMRKKVENGINYRAFVPPLNI